MYRSPFASLLASLLIVEAATLAREPSLRRKLQTGKPVTVVIFGDSISAGYQIPNPEQDAFYALFRDVLHQAFPKSQAQVIARGLPGATVADGLSVVNQLVIAADPDLVTVQFGGNDERLKTPPDIFKSRLAGLVQHIRTRTSADVLMLIQPFQQREGNCPQAVAVREVAQGLKIPVADFDTALRKHPHDMRGWYAPFFNHPREYSSNIMARELWDVFGRMIERPAELSVELLNTVTDVKPGANIDVTTRIRNLTSREQAVALQFQIGPVTREQRVRIAPRLTKEVVLPLNSPARLPATRSLQRRIMCVAATGTSTCFDTKWLSCNPVLAPRALSRARQDPSGVAPTSPPAITLDSSENIVLGAGNWHGPEDLGLSVWCGHDADTVRLDLRVSDDLLRTRKEESPDAPMFFGDCVQLNLDCRPREQQGMPFFSEGVHLFFLVPGHDSPRYADWSFGERPERTIPPPERLGKLTMKTQTVPGGYHIAFVLPLALLAGDRPVRNMMVGMDIAVDDVDRERGRDTQMVWAGTALNYLKPSFYGALDLNARASRQGGVGNRIRATLH